MKRLLIIILITWLTNTLIAQLKINTKEIFGEECGCISFYYGNILEKMYPDTVVCGEFPGDHFGWSTSSAGDFNGDGYKDFIIGAPGNIYTSYSPGKVYLFLGGTDFDFYPDLILEGNNEDAFGYSVNYAGDINGDSLSDILVGARGYAKIIYGGIDLDNLSITKISLESSNHTFGTSTSSAGDFNNDGFSDIIIGDPEYTIDASKAGAAFLYFGSQQMDTIPDLIFLGRFEEDLFSDKMTLAGDINIDGYADILITAPRTHSTIYDNSYVFAYYGGETPDTIYDLSLKFFKKDPTGYNISGAGDLNNDGYDDFAVGAPDFGQAGLFNFTYIYLGSENPDTIADIILHEEFGNGFYTDITGAGDLNFDGFDDIATCYSGFLDIGKYITIYKGGLHMDSLPDYELKGWKDFYGYEFRSLSNIGDINNDGYSEFIIGEPLRLSPDDQTSINSLNNITNLKIYPNPVNSILYIELPENESYPINYEIITVIGNIQLQGTLNSYSENTNKLNVSMLDKGFYILRVYFGDESISKIFYKNSF